MKELFPVHTADTAPEDARPLLLQAEKNLGMVPNLERVMASAPTLLAGYVQLWELFDQTSLTPIERQVVYQTANFENECNYCVPWHTHLSQIAKMAPEDIQALRDGSALSDSKLEALRHFTQALVRTQGKISQSDMDAFVAHGWSSQHALEVVLGLAVKTMSNYTNSIAGTPLDKAVEKFTWKKSTVAMR
jgi:uncharacterized peroxidase-related enzyme